MGLIPVPVGFGLFLVVVVGTRIAQERALRRLDTEAKGRLVEGFSSFRLASLIPLAAIAALYLTMSSMDAITQTTLLGIILPATLVFGVGMQLLVYRKLRTMNVDAGYLRVYTICRVAMLAAFVVLMLAL